MGRFKLHWVSWVSLSVVGCEWAGEERGDHYWELNNLRQICSLHASLLWLERCRPRYKEIDPFVPWWIWLGVASVFGESVFGIVEDRWTLGGKPPFHGGPDLSLHHSDGAIEDALAEVKFFQLFFCCPRSKVYITGCNSDCSGWRNKTWEKGTRQEAMKERKQKALLNHLLLVVPESNNCFFLFLPHSLLKIGPQKNDVSSWYGKQRSGMASFLSSRSLTKAKLTGISETIIIETSQQGGKRPLGVDNLLLN